MINLNKVLRLLLFVLLLVTIPAGLFLLTPTWVRYRVTERYAFTASPETPVFLAVMVPRSGPYQRVENLVVAWEGTERRESRESVIVVQLSGVVGSSDRAEAVVTYDVALLNGRTGWKTPVKDEDLEPEKEIESDAPALVRQAAEVGERAYPIYAFTARHLTWPAGSRVGEGASALTAYETRVGVCGDFANLMTALSRASGIPARSIHGLAFPIFMPPYTTQQRVWLHPGAAHAWAEVATGEGWTLADPSLASNLPLDRFWFGRSLGQYLSYGPRASHDTAYEGMMVRAKERGELVGAMSAPVTFVAAAEAGPAVVEPVVSVRKVADLRWWCAVGSYAAIAVGFALIERRLSVKKRPRRTVEGS